MRFLITDKDKNWGSGTTAPTTGTSIVGDVCWNTSTTLGGVIGWVCVLAGTANNAPWVASTAYTVGQKVNVNNKVYEVTVAGTSGATAPSHTTGTATDGTVTWKYISALAVFEPFGVIGESQTVLKSADGSRFKITIGNDGALTTTKL